MDYNMQSITGGLASTGVFPSKGNPDIMRVMLLSVFADGWKAWKALTF